MPLEALTTSFKIAAEIRALLMGCLTAVRLMESMCADLSKISVANMFFVFGITFVDVADVMNSAFLIAVQRQRLAFGRGLRVVVLMSNLAEGCHEPATTICFAVLGLVKIFVLVGSGSSYCESQPMYAC